MKKPTFSLSRGTAMAFAGTAFVSAVLMASAASAHDHKGGGRHDGPLKDMMEKIDTDGNGKISKAEMEAAKKARFAKSDLNGDGKVTIEELREAREKRREDRMSEHFKRMDANNDGVLTEDELTGHRPPMDFDAADTDGDGELSKEERRAFHKEMRKKWHDRKEAEE